VKCIGAGATDDLISGKITIIRFDRWDLSPYQNERGLKSEPSNQFDSCCSIGHHRTDCIRVSKHEPTVAFFFLSGIKIDNLGINISNCPKNRQAS
jgi:hypothetical protein